MIALKGCNHRVSSLACVGLLCDAISPNRRSTSPCTVSVSRDFLFDVVSESQRESPACPGKSHQVEVECMHLVPAADEFSG